MDRKPFAAIQTPQIADTIMYNFPTTPNVYDFSSGQLDSGSTPSLSSATLSHAQDSFPASPTTYNDQSFPLADLSAMMFPSADPFAYQNQTAAPAQSYDNLIKNLGNDPSFPFPSTLEEMRLHREANGFIPPSSTFGYNNGNGTDHNAMQDGDVQLLGPMPMYMMQGGPTPQQQNASNNNGDYSNVGQHFQQQGQPATYGPSSANVNLDQLLGGEEWAYRDHDRNGNMAQVFTQSGRPFSGKMNARGTDTPGQQSVSFDDLNPGALGWNLDGY